jgi:hypothetical protein
VPVELHFAQVWSFREGMPVRMVFYADTDIDEARRAAVLAPTPPGP